MTAPLSSHYSWKPEFDEISSFKDEQVPSLLQELTSDETVIQIVDNLFLATGLNNGNQEWLRTLGVVESISLFQDWIEKHIFPAISNTYEKLTSAGLSNLDPQQAYIFISNHRDIIMDPLLLNLLLKQNQFSTAHCAIGDNLLSSEAANNLARLNNCFKVIRSLKSPKAILRAMKLQSEYIGHRRFVDGENIWIAQKEGRSKDNTDKTNPALIKMLSLAKPKSLPFNKFVNTLNIVPVCYSYEWDPCDIDKARQLESTTQSQDNETRQKQDLLAVQKGLTGNKGNIHVEFGEPIHINEDETHKDVAQKIDDFISQHYQLYPVNYAATRKLNTHSSHNTDCVFSKQQINKASKSLEDRVSGEAENIQKRVIQGYSAPLVKSQD